MRPIPIVCMTLLLHLGCNENPGGTVNRAPELSALGEISVYARERVRFPVTTSDPDGDQVTVTAHPLPAGASFHDGVFLWQTLRTDTGVHTVMLTATDGIEETLLPVTITIIGTVTEVDTCLRIRVLKPEAGATFRIGDTMSIIWAIDPAGVYRGVRVMLSPNAGLQYAIFNDDEGFRSSDTSIYAGNIGLYKWVVAPTATTEFFTQIPIVGDSCMVQILGDYDENKCTGERPLAAQSEWMFRITR